MGLPFRWRLLELVYNIIHENDTNFDILPYLNLPGYNLKNK